MKNKKIGLRVKIILPTIILILFGFLVVSTAGYIRLRNNVNALGSDYSSTLAQLAATVINGDQTNSLNRNTEASAPLYFKLQEQINTLMEHKEYRNIVVINKDVKTGEFFYVLDTSGGSTIGETVTEDLDMINQAFEGETINSKEMSTYDYGDGVEYNIIFAYAPIKNTMGKVVGVVGIDFDANLVRHKLNKAQIERTGMLIVYPSIILFTLLSIIVSIIRNIRKINDSLEEILHNNGDLTQRIEIKSNDEIKSIAKRMNELFKRLNNTMVDVKIVAKNLIKSTNELADLSLRTNDGITFVSASMEEISATMEVIGDTTKSVEAAVDRTYQITSEIADVSTQKALEVKNILNDVEKTYEDTLKLREEAFKYAEDVTNKVNEKIEDSRSVKEIQQLTEAVLSIASQTRLLSLNASIEAARVGEAGRGFAVVATEIGKLAEQSAKTASSIQKVSQNVVSAVDSLADESSKLIEFSKNTTEQGYGNLLNLASEYKNNMNEISNQLTSFAEDSTSLNQEMSAVKESIDIVAMSVEDSNGAITDVNTNLTDITESSARVSKQSKFLEKDTNLLLDNVNKFILGEKEEEC